MRTRRVVVAGLFALLVLPQTFSASAQHRDSHHHGPRAANASPPPPRPPVETRFLEVHTHGPFLPGLDEDELGDVEAWMFGATLVVAADGTGVQRAIVRFESLASDGVYCDSGPTADAWNEDPPPPDTPPDEPGHGYCGFTAAELAQAQTEGGFDVVFDGATIDGITYGPARCEVRFDPQTPGAVLTAGAQEGTC